MGDHDGYVFLWRRLLDSEWLTMTAGQSKVMVGCILLASWRDESAWVAGCKVPVPRGSFISSGRRMAEHFGVSYKVARGALAALQKSGFLTANRLPGGAHEQTLFTVEKYCEFQDAARAMGAPKGAPPVPQGAPPVPQGARSIYEEVEEEKKSSDSVAPLEAFTTADFLRTQIVKAKPDHRLSKDSYYNRVKGSWALELDRAHRIDGRSWKRLCQVAKWACADSFWGPNVQSAKTLRGKFDRLDGQMSAPPPARRPVHVPKQQDEDF